MSFFNNFDHPEGVIVNSQFCVCISSLIPLLIYIIWSWERKRELTVLECNPT